MAIEIVDVPIENGDFPWFFVNVYQRVLRVSQPRDKPKLLFFNLV